MSVPSRVEWGTLWDFHQVQRGYAICRTTRPLSWVECGGFMSGPGLLPGPAAEEAEEVHL